MRENQKVRSDSVVPASSGGNHTRIWMIVHLFTCTYTHAHIHIYVCTNVHTHIHMHICTHIHTHPHTCIYTNVNASFQIQEYR